MKPGTAVSCQLPGRWAGIAASVWSWRLMDAMMSCLRWHRPHKVFPWLGVPLPQPETHCGVRKGSGALDKSQMSVRSLRASQVPAPNLVPATAPARFGVDGGARYWQKESYLGAPLHCPAPLKTGQGSPWMVIGGGSGEGSCQVGDLCRRLRLYLRPGSCHGSSGWVGPLPCLWGGAWAHILVRRQCCSSWLLYP